TSGAALGNTGFSYYVPTIDSMGNSYTSVLGQYSLGISQYFAEGNNLTACASNYVSGVWNSGPLIVETNCTVALPAGADTLRSSLQNSVLSAWSYDYANIYSFSMTYTLATAQ